METLIPIILDVLEKIWPLLYAILEWWLGKTDAVQANSLIELIAKFFTETAAGFFKGIWDSVLKIFGK